MNNKMVYKILTVITLLLFVVGCSNDKTPNKTSFKVLEKAVIDNYEIELESYIKEETWNSVEPVNSKYLILEFKIKNISNVSQTINPKVNFELVDNNRKTVNMNTDSITIKSNETSVIKVIYDTEDRSTYDVIFYSGVVTNNILFMIK